MVLYASMRSIAFVKTNRNTSISPLGIAISKVAEGQTRDAPFVRSAARKSFRIFFPNSHSWRRCCSIARPILGVCRLQMTKQSNDRPFERFDPDKLLLDYPYIRMGHCFGKRRPGSSRGNSHPVLLIDGLCKSIVLYHVRCFLLRTVPLSCIDPVPIITHSCKCLWEAVKGK